MVTDADLRARMRDARYTDGTRAGSAAFRAEVARGWSERYPGAAQPYAAGRLVPVQGYTRTVERDGKEVQEQVRAYLQLRHGRGPQDMAATEKPEVVRVQGRPAPSRESPSAAGTARVREPSASQARFYDLMAGPVTEMADRLGVQPEWILGLSAFESGWLRQYPRNQNAFGAASATAKTRQIDSLEASITEWERIFGPRVRGATSAEDFLKRLQGEIDGRPAPWQPYNSENASSWPAAIMSGIRSVEETLPAWRARQVTRR